MTDGAGQSLPTVSVIIPTYDDAERLSLCLRALQAQTYPAELIQVVVADNASTEDQHTALPPGDDRFVMVEESRRGSYAARNAAVAVATGEVFAFTDSDCLPHASWISSGVQALTAAAPPPDAVGGAITLVFRHGPKPVTGPELYESLHGFEQRQYVEKHGFAATANLFVRASTFHAVGPFDASLRSGGDLNWGKRLTSSGRTLVYSPATVIDHPSRPSWSELTTKSRRVAGGLADLAAVMPTRTVLARCARELRGGMAVWRRVWRMSPPDGAGAKVRYAAAYSYVSGLRSAVQLGRLVDRRTPRAGRAQQPPSQA